MIPSGKARRIIYDMAGFAISHGEPNFAILVHGDKEEIENEFDKLIVSRSRIDGITLHIGRITVGCAADCESIINEEKGESTEKEEEEL